MESTAAPRGRDGADEQAPEGVVAHLAEHGDGATELREPDRTVARRAAGLAAKFSAPGGAGSGTMSISNSPSETTS